MVPNGIGRFALVRAGSEPARTVNQTKDMEVLSRIMLSKNSRPGFLCAAWRTNLKASGLTLTMIVLLI